MGENAKISTFVFADLGLTTWLPRPCLSDGKEGVLRFDQKALTSNFVGRTGPMTASLLDGLRACHGIRLGISHSIGSATLILWLRGTNVQGLEGPGNAIASHDPYPTFCNIRSRGKIQFIMTVSLAFHPLDIPPLHLVRLAAVGQRPIAKERPIE